MNAHRTGTSLVFGGAIAVLLGSFVATYLIGLAAIAANRELAASASVSQNLTDALAALKDAETSQRGYLLTGNEQYLQPFEPAVARFSEIETELRKLTQDGQLPTAFVDELERTGNRKIAELQLTVKLRRDKGLPAAMEVVRAGEGLALMNQLRSLGDGVTRLEKRRREHALEQANYADTRRSAVFGIALVVDLAVFAWAWRRIVLEIRSRATALKLADESAQHLATTLASIGDGVIVTDTDGLVTFMNGEAERLTGRRKESSHRVALPAVFPIENEQTGDPVENPVAQVLREGRTIGLANHTALVAANGTRTPIADSAAPIRTSDGKLIGVVLVFRDATAERTAAEQKYRLAAIVESSDDAIIAADFAGRILSWNYGAQRMFGYTEAEAVGQPTTLIIPPDRQHEEKAFLERIRRGERTDHFRTIRRHKDGHDLAASVTLSPVLGAHGEVIGASKIVRDITAIQGFELELKRRVEERTAELNDKTRQLEGFVYTVAHDLRSPLRAINGYSELLGEELATPTPPVATEYLGKIKAAAARMDLLILDLLAYSRVSQVDIKLEPVSLRTLVTNALATLRLEVQRTAAIIEVEGDLPAVQAEPGLLEQAVLNLLSNAIKFVAPGVPPKVRIWTEPAGEKVRLLVRDHGIGIAPDYHQRIFNIFERLKPAQSYPGTGVGLAIVARAAERIGGKVGVESAVGIGSTFWIELKRAPG